MWTLSTLRLHIIAISKVVAKTEAVRRRSEPRQKKAPGIRFLIGSSLSPYPGAVPSERSKELPRIGSRRLSWRSGSILDQGVVTGSTVEHIQTRAAFEDVVSRTAGQRVVSVATDEDVITVATVGRKENPGV